MSLILGINAFHGDAAACIVRDGEIVRTAAGIRTHPAVKEEIALRSFVARTLQRLGITLEPLRGSP